MDIKQLRYFIEVAKYENVSKAAERLFISQQALSKSIKNLEEELGVNLFDREKNSIKLNHYGKTALLYAIKMQELIASFEDALLQEKSINTFVVGSSSLTSIRFLFPAVSKAFPEYMISSKAIEESQIKKQLLTNQIDVAVSFRKMNDPKIESFVFLHERLMIAAPKNSPLAKLKSIKLSDLTSYTILRLRDTEIYIDHIFDELCSKEGIKLNFAWQNDYIIFRELCANENYYFLSSNLARHNNGLPPNRVLIPFENEELDTTLYVAFLKDKIKREPILQWLIRHYQYQ